ncbi:MAG: cytochrome c oxidase subunit II [Thermoplasmatota archaeon]
MERVTSLTLALVLGLLVATPTALAFDHSNSPVSRAIGSLFNVISIYALVIFVFVEGLIVYVVWRFRHRRAVPQGEKHRGNTMLEIGWTAIPIVVVVIMAVLSLQTLAAIQTPPPETVIDPTGVAPGAHIHINVTGQQWLWTFRYPDGNTSAGKLRVEAGRIVEFDLVSKDVIHDFNVPELGVKIDAIPGRVNHFWFQADNPGTYQAQCVAFCGGSHAYMRALIEVFPVGSQPKPYGELPSAAGGAGGNVTATWNVEAHNDASSYWFTITGPGCGTGNNPACTAKPGDTIAVSFANKGDAPHNFQVDVGSTKLTVINCCVDPGATATGTFTVPKDASAGAATYYCLPHRSLGMKGTLTITAA